MHGPNWSEEVSKTRQQICGIGALFLVAEWSKQFFKAPELNVYGPCDSLKLVFPVHLIFHDFAKLIKLVTLSYI